MGVAHKGLAGERADHHLVGDGIVDLGEGHHVATAQQAGRRGCGGRIYEGIYDGIYEGI